MIQRIDQSRLAHARKTRDFLVSREWDDGRFYPVDGQWPESSGYQEECAGTLALAGHILNDDRYVAASRKIFDRFLKERVDGLWTTGTISPSKRKSHRASSSRCGGYLED